MSPKTVSNVVNGQVPGARRDPGAGPARAGRPGLRAEPLGARAAQRPDRGHRARPARPVDGLLRRHGPPHRREAKRRGWSVQIEETGTNGSRQEAELLSRAREHLVDGVILNPVLPETSAVQRGVSLPPVVLIGEVDQPAADHVWTDNVVASRVVTGMLLASGHRRVGVLGVMQPATSRLREQGYSPGVRDARLPLGPEPEHQDQPLEPGGRRPRWRVLARRQRPPDALFCFTDSLALGALHAFADAGVAGPRRRVAWSAIDDVAEAAHLTTAADHRRLRQGGFRRGGADLLAERIAEPDAPITCQTVPSAWSSGRASARADPARQQPWHPRCSDVACCYNDVSAFGKDPSVHSATARRRLGIHAGGGAPPAVRLVRRAHGPLRLHRHLRARTTRPPTRTGCAATCWSWSASSGVTVVRYPGGNFVSGYRWEDGVGPAATGRAGSTWPGTRSRPTSSGCTSSSLGRQGRASSR